ncbi:MAG TPA: carbon starvation CstA family protein, partial [Pirellulales bacterium]
KYYPTAVLPSFGLMLVAVALGVYVYKYNGSISIGTPLALIAFGALIVWGVEQPLGTYNWFTSAETAAALEQGKAADPAIGPAFAAPYGSVAAKNYLEATGNAAASENLVQAERSAYYVWVAVLLAYGFIASVLPVWLLLQPRDYINSFQLYAALSMLLVGLLVAAATGSAFATIHAPAFRPSPTGGLPLMPFITVTIACGAVSGFHSLVASGTTVRQLNSEQDALPIGYGGMLVEGALAVLVVLACTAGLGAVAWAPNGLYSDWSKVSGLAAGLSTVCEGGANFLSFVGMPIAYGRAFIAVTVVAFALTTLDSATRLLRFNVEEIFKSIGLERFADRYTASFIAVLGIAVIALVPAGRTLWTMFGSVNQLLAALALTTVTVFLYQLNRPIIYTIVPAVLMLASTTWAMTIDLAKYWKNAFAPELGSTERNAAMLLGTLTAVLLCMTVWMLIEAALAFSRGPRGPEALAEKSPEPTPSGEPVVSPHVG